MSRENVEIVRGTFDVFRGRDTAADAGFGDRDAAALAEVLHPEIEWDATRTPVDDLRGMYHGHLGVAEFWRRWLEAWEIVEFDEPELIDAGDHVFVWIERQTMRGKGSGVKVELPFPYGWVITFADGKMTRVAMYVDRREALKAAGLSE